MIVVLKQADKGITKAMVRDSVFFEVDEDNKKMKQVNPGSISGVYSLADGTCQFIPPKQWIEEAQKNNFWGT